MKISPLFISAIVFVAAVPYPEAQKPLFFLGLWLTFDLWDSVQTKIPAAVLATTLASVVAVGCILLGDPALRQNFVYALVILNRCAR